MKIKFETGYRTLLVILLVLWAWSLWAAVQSATNLPAPVKTNSLPLVRTVEQWQENPVTFGLDDVGFLREHSVLHQPLWKYLASLIYILLAFYVAKLLDWST